MAVVPPLWGFRRRWLQPAWVLLALAVLAVLALLAGPRLALALAPRYSVQVVVDGRHQATFETRSRTVAEALAGAGIGLSPADQVTPERDRLLATVPGGKVHIRRAQLLKVEADGLTRTGYSAATGISAALAELGVTLGELDRVQVHSPSAGVLDVKVVRVRHEVALETEEVPFETVKRAVDHLPEGTIEELQAGVPGRIERTLRHTYEDGQLTATEVVSETRVQEPVPRILAYGTAGTVARGGEVYRYRQVLEMRATAYSPGDGYTPGRYTATGILAQRGVAAVDPAVIPLGTRLYVDGYGPALAADTGGAIKGHRIDLAFDTPEEARQYGVQYVKVYILDTP